MYADGFGLLVFGALVTSVRVSKKPQTVKTQTETFYSTSGDAAGDS